MFDSSIAAEVLTESPSEVEFIAQLSEQMLEDWVAPAVPASLPWLVAENAPGLVLAAALSDLDVSGLSGRDRVSVMRAHQRMVSHFQAKLYESMALVADAVVESLGEDAVADPALAEQAAASEIRAALRLTRKAADSELAVARGFQHRLPEVWEALAAGRIDRRRANLMLHQSDHLSTVQARDVSRRVMGQAPELTTGQLTALLKKLSVENDPADAKVRYEHALQSRRVVIEPTLDGTAHLHLYDIAPDKAMRISRRCNAAARRLKNPDETRTMDQLRTDVATDILEAHAAEGFGQRSQDRVTITAPLTTLAGLDDNAGDLNGYGPVISDLARQVAEQSHGGTWSFMVTDDEGRPIHTGVTRRRPSRSDQRHVEAAYPACVFPGCRMPASDCDLDHRETWAEGGSTTPDNLAPLCRHDHRMRHQGGWGYERSETGDHSWSSPLGQRYEQVARAP